MQGLGEEVGMRKYRFVIPIFLLVASILTSMAILDNKRDTVRRIFDEAGRQNRPVIFLHGWSEKYITSYNVLSIPGDWVEFSGRRVGPSLGKTFFTKDGTLLIIGGYDGIARYEDWQVEFPDIRPIPIVGTSPYALPAFQQQPSFYGSPHENVPGGGSLRETEFTFREIPDTGQAITTSTQGYGIINIITGETVGGTWSGPPPWIEDDSTPTSWGDLIASPDATAIVARNRYSTELDWLSVYDIPASVWSDALKVDHSSLDFAVGNHADVIAIGDHSPTQRQIHFINGYTGELYWTVNDAMWTKFGNRWAVCEPAGVFDIDKIILVDMEDDFREYWVEFRIGSLNEVAIYEPPPGGVEEMLEMRRGEER